MQLQLYGKQILVYRKPIDFRMGINGLASLVMNELHYPPQENLYLFYNRHRDKIKYLTWHKNGFLLVYKRLEKHRFHFSFNQSSGMVEMTSDELTWALAGLEWQKMRDWRELNYEKFS
jgi:transposase